MVEPYASLPATDGYLLRYRTWPTTEPRKATVVLVNGLMSHSGWFEPIALPLTRGGIAVVGADRRGSGPNLEGRGDAPSGKALVDDLIAIALAEDRPPAPLVLIGWCWGVVPVILAAAELGPKVRGLGLLAPGLWSTQLIEERMTAARGIAAGKPEGEACLPSPISEELFTEGPLLESFVLADEARVRTLSPRMIAVMGRMGMGAIARLKKLALPSLLVLAEDDRATDNDKALAGLAGQPRLTVRRLPGAHALTLDAPEALASTILAWLETSLGGS